MTLTRKQEEETIFIHNEDNRISYNYMKKKLKIKITTSKKKNKALAI